MDINNAQKVAQTHLVRLIAMLDKQGRKHTVSYKGRKTLVIITPKFGTAAQGAHGYARCHKDDFFVPLIGHVMALYRAVGIPVPLEISNLTERARVTPAITRAPNGQPLAATNPVADTIAQLTGQAQPVPAQFVPTQPVVTLDTTASDKEIYDVFEEFDGDADSMAEELVKLRKYTQAMVGKKVK